MEQCGTEGILKQVNDDDVNRVRIVNMVSMNEILFIHYLLVYLLFAYSTKRACGKNIYILEILTSNWMTSFKGYLYRTHSIIIHYLLLHITYFQLWNEFYMYFSFCNLPKTGRVGCIIRWLTSDIIAASISLAHSFGFVVIYISFTSKLQFFLFLMLHQLAKVVLSHVKVETIPFFINTFEKLMRVKTTTHSFQRWNE